MKITITESQFHSEFHNMGRGGRFSYQALGLLFEHFEQFEEDTGEEIELDVIAICCEYSEDDVEAIADCYDIDVDGLDDIEQEQAVLDYLNEHTSVVGQTDSGSIVYQQF